MATTPAVPDPSAFRTETGQLNPTACALASAQGLSLRQIGRQAGVSAERIRQILQKAGFASDLAVAPRRREVLARRHDALDTDVQALRARLEAAGATITPERRSRGFVVNGQRLTLHHGHAFQMGERTYLRVSAAAKQTIHVVWIPSTETYVLLAPRETSYILPVQPIRSAPVTWPRERIAAEDARGFLRAAKRVAAWKGTDRG